MKIDREKLKVYAAMPDRELWANIVKLAAERGIKLPENDPPHEELEKLRAIVMSPEKLNVIAAMKVINSYRKEHGI